MKTIHTAKCFYRTVLLSAAMFFWLALQVCAFAATEPFSDAEAAIDKAEKAFEAGGKDFEASESGARNGEASSQKSGKTSWSKAQQETRQPRKPLTAQEARDQALQGSPETGYAGTWTDPENGDIITSVIAPKPPAQNYSNSYPLYISPDISDWQQSGNSNWNGYPGWPVTPDNPGWGGAWQPSSPPYSPPPGGGMGGPGIFHPYPQPPQNFNPGYRPLRPGQPGMNPGTYPSSGIQPGMNPGQYPPPYAPGQNPSFGQPGFNPGQNPPPPGQPGLPGMSPSWPGQSGIPPASVPPTPALPGLGNQPGQPPAWQPGSALPGSGGWASQGSQWGTGMAWGQTSNFGNRFYPSGARPGNPGSIWHPGMDRPGGFNPARPWRPAGAPSRW